MLVNTGTELILFDSGNGPEGREFGTGQLASRIAASGYALSNVTIVAISHLHADHINGLMDGDRPGFSHARYVVSQAEWDFWTSTDFSETPAAMHATALQKKVLPLREKMALISAGASIAPGVTSMVAAGHTPGHMAFLLESAGRSLLLTGDTANHFVASLQNRIGKFLSTWTKAPLPAVAEGYSVCWLPRKSRLSAITCLIRRPAMSSRLIRAFASCR